MEASHSTRDSFVSDTSDQNAGSFIRLFMIMVGRKWKGKISLQKKLQYIIDYQDNYITISIDHISPSEIGGADVYFADVI